MIIFTLKIAGGNLTALVYRCNSKEKIIKKLLKNVEQVGFISKNKLKMSEGELCINATLAFASTLGKKGELYASGIKDPVECYNKGKITTIKLKLNYQKIGNVVLFDGIGFICLEKKEITKKLLLSYCNKYKLPAFGAIIYKGDTITPYVYVKAINSFFKETACGSGSLAYSIFSGKGEIAQPTGKIIKVNIKKGKLLISAEVTK